MDEPTSQFDISSATMKLPRKQNELDVELARSRIEHNYLKNIASEMRGVDGNFRLRRK